MNNQEHFDFLQHTLYEYTLTISDKLKKEDGYYHIQVPNTQDDGTTTMVCQSSKVRAMEMVWSQDQPSYLSKMDLYQFTNISISRREDY